jgi:hypothetical protein
LCNDDDCEYLNENLENGDCKRDQVCRRVNGDDNVEDREEYDDWCKEGDGNDGENSDDEKLLVVTCDDDCELVKNMMAAEENNND